MSRAQLKHVLLDVGFKDKPKVLDLEDRYGPLARLLFIDIVCAMSAATDGVITTGAARLLGKRIGFKSEQVLDILAFCVESKMLDNNGEEFTNSRVIKDQTSLQIKRDKEKERQRLWRESRVTNGVHADNETVLPDTVTDTEYNNNKNSQPQIGLIKVSDHVRLTDFSIDQFRIHLQSEGLNGKDEKAIIHKLDAWLEKNPHERRERDHYKDLMNWPLTQHRLDLAKLTRAKGTPFKPSEKLTANLKPKEF